MAQPYIGEIRLFGGTFAPLGWAFCNGQSINITEYEALYALIGLTYGGDGMTTFKVPDLQGRVPIHMGSGAGLTTRELGDSGGAESVTLTVPQLPVHSHSDLSNNHQASSQPATSVDPVGRVFAVPNDGSFAYATAKTGDLGTVAATSASAGNGLSHNNVQPFQCVNYIISLYGVFPSRT